LVPDQVLKLKQLTVLTLAEMNKVSFLVLWTLSTEMNFLIWVANLPSGLAHGILPPKRCHLKVNDATHKICQQLS
jgi:hypothetical protein